MNSAPRLSAKRVSRRTRSRRTYSPRQLTVQQLEPRQLLAVIGDWAAIDLRTYLTDATTDFKDLSGVVFHGDQVAVTANVLPDGADEQGRLILVDIDLDLHTAQVAVDQIVPSLGGDTETLAVNSDGSTVYMTGYSLSPASPQFGEAFRATWDGTTIQTEGLGFIAGKNSTTPENRSVGIAVTPSGVVAGASDAGRAIFEYDQAMVHAGDLEHSGVIYGISDDRVKAGLDVRGVVWEADNETKRYMDDPYGDGIYVFGISPDHSRLPGSGLIFGVGGYSIEKLIWWEYDGTAHVVLDSLGVPIDGRLTSATNADVGYQVGRSNPASAGDLLHIESTNQTLRIEQWFESLSGLDVPAETSEWGPEIAYNYATGHVAIISGGYLYTAKIWDDNLPPVGQADSYVTPVGVTLTVNAPGILDNDTDDGEGPLQAMLVSEPSYGTLDLNADGSFVYTPMAKFNREDQFTYRASDGAYESSLVTVNIMIDTQFPWHNGLMRLDVNDSGTITSLDALRIINVLNASGSADLPTPRPRPLVEPFLDTSADNKVTPLDALLIINYLNGLGPAEAEGEAEPEGESDIAPYENSSLAPIDSATLLAAGWSTVNVGGAADMDLESSLGQLTGATAPPMIEIAPPQTGYELRSRPAEEEAWSEFESPLDLEETLSAILDGNAEED
ncbi:MAG: Ig-like domain-containing protein [Pirellulaceae bacterium]